MDRSVEELQEGGSSFMCFRGHHSFDFIYPFPLPLVAHIEFWAGVVFSKMLLGLRLRKHLADVLPISWSSPNVEIHLSLSSKGNLPCQFPVGIGFNAYGSPLTAV